MIIIVIYFSQETKKLFGKIIQKEIEAYSSAYVSEELDRASERRQFLPQQAARY